MKTLVDTSVWIDHFRRKDLRLEELLQNNQVLCHEFVLGELACGKFKKRERVLEDLSLLPQAALCPFDEALMFLESKKLCGKGLGWVDVNLILSARLAGADLYTRDKMLGRCWRNLCRS